VNKQVRIDRDGEVITMTLDNAAAGNEITGGMFDAMLETLLSERSKPKARVLRIRAEGEVFCLGRERAGKDEASINVEINRLIALKRAVMESPLISIAEVQGNAAGFGVGLAVVSDFTYVAESAMLSFPEMKKGLPPAAIMAYLSRYALPKRLFPLVLFAQEFTPAQAREMGLVTHVSSKASLRADVDAVVARILAMDAEGARQCKAYFHAAQEGTLAQNFTDATGLLVAQTLRLQGTRS
jgi:enoyl-CoA hydratase/carnithine racemase